MTKWSGFIQQMDKVKEISLIGILAAVNIASYLGMGIWTFFQILAWIVICLLTQCMGDFYRRKNKNPSLLVMAVFSLVMGYVFGLIVSLEQFVIGGLPLFIVYYSTGLLFDTFHAVGNFFFYLIGAPLLWKVFKKYRKC